MKKLNFQDQKGFVLIQIVIAVVLAVAIIVGGFFAFKTFQTKRGEAPEKESAVGEQEIENISAPTPLFDFSVSPIKEIQLSTFNLGQASPGLAFTNLSLDTKIGYTGNTNLNTPTITLTAPTNFNITTPTAPVTNTNTNVNTNTNTNTSPAVDCSQFSSVPSCSYVGAVGSEGYEACKQCYPNK
jgi:hypothetical protein